MDSLIKFRKLVHKIRFNVLWTEGLILRLLVEGNFLIRVIDKKLFLS